MIRKKVTVQGICYDKKSSFQRGPASAPGLIRQRFWSEAYNHFAENGKEISPSIINDLGDFHIDKFEQIYEITKANLNEEHKLLTLGGDHSVTFPVVHAVSESLPEFEILHIDAHADVYDEFEGDKYSHACPFARIMENGLTSRLVQVGIRTLTPHQRAQIEKFNVEVIEMRNFNVRELPKFEKPVYISLDMDAFDPAFAPGVSHQESGGLNPREVLALIHSISSPIIGADIVEYNPENDYQGITAALAAKMMKEILSKIVR